MYGNNQFLIFFFFSFFARTVWEKQNNPKMTTSQRTLYKDTDFSCSLWRRETSCVAHWHLLLCPALQTSPLSSWGPEKWQRWKIFPKCACRSIPLVCATRYTLGSFQSSWVCWLIYSKYLSLEKDNDVQEISVFHIFLTNSFFFLVSLTVSIL